MIGQPVIAFASFEDRRLFLAEQLDAYRALCDAAFNVLALSARQELKVLESLPASQSVPPVFDYSSTIKRVIESREDVEKQLERLETLSGPMAEAASLFLMPQLKTQLRGFNEQLDNLQKMQAEVEAQERKSS